MKFGLKLTELRENRGLSQEELADKLQVSRQTISNWENDKVSIDVAKAAEICRLFGVGMDYLFMDVANDSKEILLLSKRPLHTVIRHIHRMTKITNRKLAYGVRL